MEAGQAFFQVIRLALCRNASLTGKVVSSSISVSLQQAPTVYPAIRLRVSGRKGRNLPSMFEGNLYIGIYSNNTSPTGELATIYGIVKGLIDEKQATLYTSHIGIARIWEDFCSYPLYQEETGKYFLTARYGFVASHKD